MNRTAAVVLALAAAVAAAVLLFGSGGGPEGPDGPSAPDPDLTRDSGGTPPRPGGVPDAPDPAPPDVAVPGASGAVVTGTALDRHGEPVAGATVRVLPFDFTPDPMLGGLVLSQAPSGTTDSEGRFRIAGLSPGRFRLHATADGRATARSREFSLEEGGEVRIDVVFPAGPVVTGLVLDRRGKPVAGAAVGPVPEGMRAFVPGAAGGPTATTGEDGAFSLAGLDAATDLQATKEGYGKCVVAGVQPDGRDVEFVLKDLGSIAGRVVAEEGELPAFELEARSESAGMMGMGALFAAGEVEILEEGRFRVTGLEPGTYHVTAFPETLAPARAAGIAVREGEETGGVELVLGAGHDLRGLVVSAADGRPVAGAEVSAFLLANPMLAQAGRGRTRTATTGEDGAFVLPALPAGTTTVKVAHADYAGVTLSAVTLPAAEPLRVELEAGGTVLVSARRGDGTPDTGKMVILQRNLPFEQKMAMLDAEGRARFEHVPAGSWMVMRVDPQAMQERGFAGADMAMKTVNVVSGAELEVVFKPEGGATISGRVTRGGRPVAGAMVYLTAAAEGSETLEGMKFGTTREDGTYEIADVPPGEYGIAVSSPGNFVPTWSDTVVVGEGAVRRDLALPPATVAGRVEDPRGRPLGGVQVIAVASGRADFRSGTLDESMRSWGGMETTGEDGRFRFDGLSAGEYVLRVWRDGAAPTYSDVFRVPGLGDGPQDLRVELTEGVPVVVEVRGPDRAPVADAWVFATDPEGRILTTGVSLGERTDSDGIARLRLESGPHRLEVQARGLASRIVDVNVPDGSLSLIVDLKEGGRVVATVRDGEGRPVANARVALLDASGRPAGRRMTGDVLSDAGHPTRTDEKGRIELPLVAPGSWRVSATSEDGRAGEAAVEVSPGRESRVTIELED